MEEAGGGRVGFSPSLLRGELRRLRRLRRRFSSDPLVARLPPAEGSLSPRRSLLGTGPMPKGERLLGTAAAQRLRPVRADICSHFRFWRRIVGIVIAIAVILLLTWITINPPKLPQLEPCPDDWLYYKKKCYYHSGAVADWNSSQESCSDHGGSLAVIDSHQELRCNVTDIQGITVIQHSQGNLCRARHCVPAKYMSLYQNVILLNFIMYRIRIADYWIGLRRKGNKFFWVNGKSFDTNLFHVNITNDGDCVHIDSAFISTRRCSSLRNWLCTIGQFNPKTKS